MPVPTQNAESTEAKPMAGPNLFAELGLHPALLEGLAAVGYHVPTPIQSEAIPPLLAGKDLLGQAQTGTGKTAAFALPMLQRLDLSVQSVQTLILAPTRELALQVSAAVSTYGQRLGQVRLATIYGGQPIHLQIAQLRRGAQVVVGTPGRVMDCLRRGALSLATVKTVVLDEADEMLRMGFLEDVEWILAQTPDERQTVLFSATLPPPILKVAKAYQKDPVRVNVRQETRTVSSTEQRVLIVAAHQKLDALTRILDAEESKSVLVFARTRANCAELAEALNSRGHAAAALHGDMGQPQREEVMQKFRAGRIELIIATDVAARGLDVEGITHVINYDRPADTETFLHRVGRTGRAGRAGVALLFLTPSERRFQQIIERYTSQTMQRMQLPSNKDLAERRIERFKQQVAESLQAPDLAAYVQVIEQMASLEGADLTRIAAAVARMACEQRPLVVSEPEPQSNRNLKAERFRAPSRYVRFHASIGRREGLRPADLVGAIANETKIPGRAIGAIEIKETATFFDLDADHADLLQKELGRASIRGQQVTIRRARPTPGGGNPQLNRKPKRRSSLFSKGKWSGA